MQRGPAGALQPDPPRASGDIGAAFNEQERRLDLPSEERRMQRRHADAVRGDAIHVSTTIDEEPHHLEMPEVRGERERREPFWRIRIELLGTRIERGEHARGRRWLRLRAGRARPRHRTADRPAHHDRCSRR